MKCVLCRHGETAPGEVTVTLQRGATVVVVKGVPAEVCAQCGEYFLDEATTARVTALAEAPSSTGRRSRFCATRRERDSPRRVRGDEQDPASSPPADPGRVALP